MPGWVTFSLDGKYAYPSSGEVIDVKTRRVLSTLKDEFYNSVGSEKMVEVDFEGGKAVRAGDPVWGWEGNAVKSKNNEPDNDYFS